MTRAPRIVRVSADSRTDSLERLRARIDEIDARLVALLDERARLAFEIGGLKRRIGHPIVDPVREGRVLDGVRTRAGRVMPSEDLQHILAEIIKACRRLQQQ